MKHLARILSLLILVSAGLFFANCGGDDPDSKSDEEIQLAKFKFTWELVSAEDPSDRTDEYPNMTTTFSGTFAPEGTYNYTSDADSWPSISPWEDSGTWEFKTGAVNNTIVRISDGQEMNYVFSNGDKTLTISFDYSGPGFANGRTKSVEGDWEFVFSRP